MLLDGETMSNLPMSRMSEPVYLDTNQRLWMVDAH
jgi:hypothetical protein